MRFALDENLAHAGAYAPRRALRAALRQALGDRHVALCLHRVDASRTWLPAMSMPASELDALIELLLASRPHARECWLTLTFDDGYADAARYVASRAPRYPEAAFVLFVCPEKTERRRGFRWDVVEERLRAGAPPAEAQRLMAAPYDVSAENDRDDLARIAAREEFRLATWGELREVSALPNVALGNHTNCHFPCMALDRAAAREEHRRSSDAFARLFGEERHFAFPFGTPGVAFGADDVALVRARSGAIIWSTERRPFLACERVPGAVLPRFPIVGTWSHRGAAAIVAAWSALHSVRGTRHRFPP